MPRPHFTPGKDPVPILQESGWATGPVWTGGKSRPHGDSIPDRPARSSVAIPTELPGPHFIEGEVIKKGNILCNFEIHILKLSTPSILSVNHLLLLQLNAHNLLNTNLMCIGSCIIVINEE